MYQEILWCGFDILSFDLTFVQLNHKMSSLEKKWLELLIRTMFGRPSLEISFVICMFYVLFIYHTLEQRYTVVLCVLPRSDFYMYFIFCCERMPQNIVKLIDSKNKISIKKWCKKHFQSYSCLQKLQTNQLFQMSGFELKKFRSKMKMKYNQIIYRNRIHPEFSDVQHTNETITH